MQSRTCKLTAFTLSTGMAFGAAAMAADLPKEGTIKLHSTIKGTGQAVDVGEKHLMGNGNGWGVTFNDAGSGPLHMGAWMCTWTFQNVSSPTQISGNCAFGDAGGTDKIFTAFSGTITENVSDQGTGTIVGGIGKYSGVQGKMSWQCKTVDPAQILSACTQQFDYELKAMSAAK
jgi:hypothetical protein